MKNIVELMSVYASHHNKTITKVTHFIGIPAILLGIQIILSWLYLPFAYINHFSIAWLALIALLIYYVLLDIYLALLSAIFLLPLTIVAQLLSDNHFTWPAFFIFCILFITGWIIQLIGHYFEGKQPALLGNLFQVFIAPIFLIAELCFVFGYRKDLKDKINTM